MAKLCLGTALLALTLASPALAQSTTTVAPQTTVEQGIYRYLGASGASGGSVPFIGTNVASDSGADVPLIGHTGGEAAASGSSAPPSAASPQAASEGELSDAALAQVAAHWDQPVEARR